MSAESSHFLRLVRADEADSYVIIEASPKGSGPLEVKLVATEGMGTYSLELNASKAASSRAKNSPLTPDEWEGLLSQLFEGSSVPEAIEITASVQSESSVTITVRQRAQGITQRIGSITLSHNEDEVIELFDWCGAAIGNNGMLQAKLRAVNARAKRLEENIADLKKQLDELVSVAQDDQNILLDKFRDLLNEKKAKIRDQQILLSSLTHDGSTSVRGGEVGLQAKGGKEGKRKAPSGDNEDGEDDGFEPMEVDAPRGPNTDSEEQQTTDGETDPGDEDTASEAEPEEPEPKPSARAGKGKGRKRQSRQPPAPKALSREPPSKHTRSKDADKSDNDEEPPAKRSLPFARRKGAAESSAAAWKPQAGHGDSDSDGDEL